MTRTVPQWPYLAQTGGAVVLHLAQKSAAKQLLGDYCGEWGCYLDERDQPAGVRLMYFFDYLSPDSEFVRASNARVDGQDLIILIREPGLPNVDCMPYLPVYQCITLDGHEILQLSGYE